MPWIRKKCNKIPISSNIYCFFSHVFFVFFNKKQSRACFQNTILFSYLILQEITRGIRGQGAAAESAAVGFFSILTFELVSNFIIW